MEKTLADPKGLIREAYAIERISLGECRSIFLDWALSLARATDAREAMLALLADYGARFPGHPMNGVLTDGLVPGEAPKRRGGRAARIAT